MAIVKFWIALRNTVVHRSGWISTRFVKNHSATWTLLFGGLTYIPQLSPGRAVLLHHDVVNHAALNLYRAALALSNELETISQGRRGHPWAPSPRPKPEPVKEVPPNPGPLLMNGDHPLSFRWATDEEFRQDFTKNNLP